MQKLVLLFVLVAASLTQPKTFTRCGLAQELKTQGFPADNLADWVCLVENESRRRTDRVGKLYEDGSRDYGLFSINDLYWCSKNNTPGNDCNATCSQMTTDDITKASMCAKAVFNLHGFDEWYGWRNHCKGRRLPDISKCFMNNKRKKPTERPRSIHSRATTPVSRPHTTAPTPHVPRYTTVPPTRAPYFWVPPLW